MAAAWRVAIRESEGIRLADSSFDLPRIVAGLREARARWRESQHRTHELGGRELPSRESLAAIVEGLRGALFPMRLGPIDLRQETEDFYVGHTLDSVLGLLLAQVRLELRHQARQHPVEGDLEARARTIAREFGAELPRLRTLLDTDVLAAFEGDPAARSVDEVLLCYPGVHAMIHHRIAHELYLLGVPLLARLVAELAHGATGIDIHPGATIGPGFFIDHGTGVVIGETARIGRNVRLYQAVTLGAKRFPTDAEGHLQKGGSRHPILEDDVVDLRRGDRAGPRHHRQGRDDRRQRVADPQRAPGEPDRAGECARRRRRRQQRALAEPDA